MAGLTGSEIARLLERSPAAVKMLQQRAFTQLRAVLAAERGGEEADHHG
jgi:DNA-directed RNA polymerase specialized sigma24 family protein